MSAQGGTLARRGAVHLPIWPVAALLAAAAAAAIGMSILSGTEGGLVTSVSNTERLANSSAAVREQGATLPFERPFVRIQAQAEAAAEGLVTSPVGLENPGAYGISQVTEATSPVGLENPGAYPAEISTPKAGRYEPIEVNGTICGQCR
jgi:hypothetical protein